MMPGTAMLYRAWDRASKVDPRYLIAFLITLVLVAAQLRYHMVGGYDRLIVALGVCLITEAVLSWFDRGVMAHMKDDPRCDARIKEFKATIRCIPLVDEYDGGGKRRQQSYRRLASDYAELVGAITAEDAAGGDEGTAALAARVETLSKRCRTLAEKAPA